jgi:hypothetical protein
LSESCGCSEISGSHTQGKNMTFRPGNYHGNGFIRQNPTTGSTHVPGLGVAKPSGVYRPMGNGYYRNPNTGNVYNSGTGAYKFR